MNVVWFLVLVVLCVRAKIHDDEEKKFNETTPSDLDLENFTTDPSVNEKEAEGGLEGPGYTNEFNETTPSDLGSENYITDLSVNEKEAEDRLEGSGYTTSSSTSFCEQIPRINISEIISNSSSAILKWKHPEKVECVEKYVIFVNDEQYNYTNDNKIIIEDLAECTTYKIGIAVSKANITGPRFEENFKTKASELPKVEIISVTPSNFNVKIKWKPPKNPSCFDNYIVYLDNEKIMDVPMELDERIIEDLIACNKYYISIAVTQEGDIGPQKSVPFKTTSPEPFNYGVEDVNIEKVDDDILNVTWQAPPENVRQCITTYYILWYEEGVQNPNTHDKIVDASKTYLEISPIIGCMKYAIDIKPRIEFKEGLNIHENYQSEPLPTNPPKIVYTRAGQTEITVTWETDDKSKNRCPISMIEVTCEALPENNQDFPWIIPNVTITKKINQQSPNFRYTVTIEEVSPFTNYTCKGFVENSGGNSNETSFEEKTKEDAPSNPKNIHVKDIGPHKFTIEWSEPYKIPGIMEFYYLSIYTVGPLQPLRSECSNNVTDHYFERIDSQILYHVFDKAVPYYHYRISILGAVGDKNGTAATIEANTEAAVPDMVENVQTEPPIYSQTENYSGVISITFDPPCNVNGPFKHYKISYIGKRAGFKDQFNSITTNDTKSSISLQPEREYSIYITVETENFSSQPAEIPSFQSRPGVPILAQNLTAPVSTDSKAYFRLTKSAFDETNGEIIAYSLILLSEKKQIESFGFWNGTNEGWPSTPQQLTPNFWNPFQDGVETINFTIGAEDSCKETNYCNKILKDDTKYWLIARALTKAAYKDSSLLPFQTDVMDDLNSALGIGLTFGILALLILSGFLLFLWRKNRKNLIVEEEKRVSVSSPESIPCGKFLSYYAGISENYNMLKQQYTDLGLQSKAIGGSTTFATLIENRRKNRYTNIFPFDETRVKLNIDEDDEISSDYINASYIKGYSGKTEYIATQGPLESTTRDFWKMVLQENATIIVMVSQFVEQNKEKCFHYFPNNHETVQFGESLEVKCSTELHFGTYCIRTLQVCKGVEQRHVTHMQFLEWPDFGVPEGTDHMFHFVGQLREKANSEGGLIVVHCSAGVGRTGTLIALDIILQTIDDHRDINIYKTVLDLRKQRTNMVQTEKQYMFIYTCVKDYLEIRKIQTNDGAKDRIYKNLDKLRSSLIKNGIETELESAL